MLTTNFHRNYTGGALAFLDDWERAAVKLAAASPREAFTYQQKRSNFSMRFSVLGLTDTLVDSVMDDTTNWHQFTDTLRRRLVRRQDQEGRDCIGADKLQSVTVKNCLFACNGITPKDIYTCMLALS